MLMYNNYYPVACKIITNRISNMNKSIVFKYLIRIGY